MEVPMAMDSIRLIYEHFRLAEPREWGNIDLVLCTNGGDGTVPWRLATLIREKSKKFSALIPFRAFHAGTLTALGADAVVMHPMGMLGPTDPTVANNFNPIDPLNPGQRLGISVEDVSGYIALIKEDAGIRHDDERVLAFNKLADQVHPLALGNVKRSLSQSRMMAQKLLELHLDPTKDEPRIRHIVDSLTSKLFFHGHPINRDEAKNEIGLTTVEKPNKKVEDLIWNLYVEYENEMRLNEPFNVVFEFMARFPALPPGSPPVSTPTASAKVAFVESDVRTDVLSLEYELFGFRDQMGATKVHFMPRSQAWGTE